MAKVFAFFAEGTEEIECLTVVDILRRGSVDVELISITENKTLVGSHKITVVCDKTIEEADFETADLLFLPGGMPGVTHLEQNQKLLAAIKAHKEKGKLLAAICAAPSIFGHLGFLNGLPFTCFPGFQEGIDGVDGAKWTGAAVENTEQFITGRGMGVAVDFSLALLAHLKGKEVAAKIKAGIQHPETL